MTIARMRSTLTQREFERWRKYWEVEPWGPWRDNMHAAIIARNVLLPFVKKGSKINLDDFMLMLPEIRKSKDQRQASQALVTMLRSIAGTPTKRTKRKRISGKG